MLPASTTTTTKKKQRAEYIKTQMPLGRKIMFMREYLVKHSHLDLRAHRVHIERTPNNNTI